MSTPPTIDDAMNRGLVHLVDGQFPVKATGIHTFSNGTEWECWAEPNCLSCRFYELDGNAGEFCAFEGLATLGAVTPELARLFGWVQKSEYADYRGPHDTAEHRHGWHAPDACPFFRNRTDDDDGGRSQSVPPDPAQLVLIADPTEDIALATLPATHHGLVGQP